MASGFSTASRSAAPGRVIDFGDYRERKAEWLPVLISLPGRPPETSGILLLDCESDELHLKFRSDWSEFGGEEDVEVLEELEHDLNLKAREFGGQRLLEWLEENASQTIQIGQREEISVRNFSATLQRLYRQHVHTIVQPYKTHLPMFSLAVAAGPFLTNPEEVEAEGWTEVPGDLKLDPNMFVAHIHGHSMEPKIPDGSLCVFRRGVVGSRNNRLVLVRNSELADENRYTVKRYRSEKKYSEEGFEHTRIRLESLNPDYPSWDLDMDETKYEIVAEFVRVLEEGGVN
jgi:phage repressor protein C with HTH and peptisase S24 domain